MLRRKTPLRATKGLRRTAGLKPGTKPLARGKKRLRPKPATIAASRAFHDAVWARWGPYCYFHRRRDPRSTVLAVHAAHIISRGRLGAAIAYGPKGGPPDPRLARPLCAACHAIQEDGLDPAYHFSLADRIDATQAHNDATKDAPWPLPTE